MGILDRRLEDERALGREHAAKLRYSLHLGPGRPLLRRLADRLLWRLLLLGLRGSGRALLCLTNAGIRWPAAALQFQQLFAKGLDFKPLLLERLLQFQQLHLQATGRALSQSRRYRQSNEGTDGGAI